MNNAQQRINAILEDKRTPWILALLVFLSKGAFLNYRSIWLDESFTLFQAQKPLTDIWKLSRTGPDPLLFFYIVHFWEKLAGIDHIYVRLIPLLFHALTAAFLFKAAKLISGNSAALLAVLLFAFSFEHFYFAFEIRTYSLVSLCTAMSLVAYLQLSRGFSAGYIIMLFCANLVLIYSHYFGWMIILNELIFLLFMVRDKKGRICILLSFVMLVVCYLPMLGIFYEQVIRSDETNWREPPYKGQFINEIRFFLNTDTVYKAVRLVLLMGILVKAYACRHNLRQVIISDDGKKVLFIFLWFFIPYMLLYIAAFRLPMFVERYILFSTIGLYLFIAAFIAYLYREHLFLKYALMVYIAALMIKEMPGNLEQFYKRPLEETVSRAKKMMPPTTTVILYPCWSDTEFAYYYDKAIFKNYRDLEGALSRSHIYPVCKAETADVAIRNDTLSGHILLFTDWGKEDPPEVLTIIRNLGLHTVPVDSAFYAEVYKLRLYKKKR